MTDLDLDKLEADAYGQHGMNLLACHLAGGAPDNCDAATILALIERLRVAEARADKAEAKVEAVKDLHRQWGKYCDVCLDTEGFNLDYPCPTIEALEEEL